MPFDFTVIFEAIITLIVAILTSIFIPFIRSKIEDYWIQMGVSAAEQIFLSNDGKKYGKEKKEYVLNWLKERNINIDSERINAKLEAAVLQLKIDLTKSSDTKSSTKG